VKECSIVETKTVKIQILKSGVITVFLEREISGDDPVLFNLAFYIEIFWAF
jgi:hypothetical protein